MSLLSCLQLVQNVASRLLTGTKKTDHISLTVASLHWLQLKYRVNLKVLLIVFKALHRLYQIFFKDLNSLLFFLVVDLIALL